MLKSIDRPDNATLRRFLLGTLLPADAERVARWVEEAPEAAGVLRDIDARDTIVDVLVASDTVSDTPAPRLAHTDIQLAVPDVFAPDVPAHIGAYRVVRELGRGGMGVVLEAENTFSHQRVALKLIGTDLASSPAARARFLAEARAVARIDHPNVVPILHIGEDRGLLYLVMPLLKGETLDARLKREKHLPTDALIRIAREVAAGLAAAHAAGLVHRDIKPANVWLEAGTGRAIILDFGLAKLLTSEAADGLTAPGAVMGTPHYMSPEQAEGKPVDSRSDLFSLGALLYHAATGERPFQGDTNLAVLIAVKTDTPTDAKKLNADLPPHLAALIRKLLAKEPDGRAGTATEVVTALNAVPAQTRPAPAKRPTRGWRSVAAVAAGLLLALGAAGAVYEFQFKTKEGTLVVEVDPDVDVRFKDGRLEIYAADGKRRYTIRPDEQSAKLLAGDYKLNVVGADGVEVDLPEFKMIRNGAVVVHVKARANIVPPPDPSADRKAIECALEAGGTVRVTSGGKEVANPRQLPQGPVRLEYVSFVGCKLTAEGAANFKGCKHLTHLTFNNCTGVTDAVVENFRDLKGLSELTLRNTNITDAGLLYFKNCPNLWSLNLDLNDIGDEGLANFKTCKKLERVHLADTQVTDKGLVHLAGCKELAHLVLFRLRGVGDDGLANFKNCHKLVTLNLVETKVTDKGLAHFRNCPDLENLSLDETQITDDGLATFKACKKLKTLSLYFQNAIPRVTDKGLAHFKDCPNLTQLMVGGNKNVTDAGLAHFKGCSRLVHLWVQNTSVTDAGLAPFKECKGLSTVYAQGTQVTAGAVDAFKKALPECRVLWDAPANGPKN